MKKNKGSLLLWAVCLIGLSLPTTANADTFTVTNADDTGIDSLRWAIEQANSNPGPDTIVFSGSYILYPRVELPPLTGGGTTLDGGNFEVIIDGSNSSTLQYGLKIDSDNNHIRNLRIRNLKTSYSSKFGYANGIYINGNSNIISSCRIYNNHGIGIVLGDLGPVASPNLMWDAFRTNGYGFGNEISNNLIQSCTIGTMDGLTPTPASYPYQRTGIFGTEKATNNIIGVDGDGTNDAEEGNTISSNFYRQIELYGPGNIIAGNKIGTDHSGSVRVIARPTSSFYSTGIYLGQNAFYSLIGTNSDGISDELERNIISGHAKGIHVQGFTDGVRISGNYIGTNAQGNSAIPNQYGIYLTNNDYSPLGSYPAKLPEIPSPLIIGTNGDGTGDEVEGNVIAGRDFDQMYSINYVGIYLWAPVGTDNGKDGGVKISGNSIGTDAAGLRVLPFDQAIKIYGSSANIIGTDGDGVSDAIEGNVIASPVLIEKVGFSGKESNYNRIAGNNFGIDRSGTQVLSFDGELFHRAAIITKGAKNTVIGTNGDGVADELEGNIFAILPEVVSTTITVSHGSNNRISGNLLTADILPSLGSEVVAVGIFLSSETYSLIGTDGDGVGDEYEGNVLLGNKTGGYGIAISYGNNNRISGNFIGTSPDGLVNSGFGNSGIMVNRTTDNLIGTDHDGVSDQLEGNVVANNGSAPWGSDSGASQYNDGITVITHAYRNSIQGNSIFDNAGLGIDLIGGNYNAASPVLAGITHDGTSFVVSGTAPVGSTVEIFIADSESTGGGGEGKFYLDRITASDGSFTFYLDSIGVDDLLTATATDSNGNTSEFSATLGFSGNRPPVLAPIGDRTVDEMATMIFTVTADDPENEPLTIIAVNVPEGAVFDGAVFTWTPDYTQAGSYQVTFSVSDSFGGSASETVNITVNAVNAQPAAAPAGGGTYRVLADITLSGQVSDYDGETLSYQWFDDQTQYCAGQIETMVGGEAVNLPACVIPGGLPVGSHSVTLEVSDGFNLPVTASVAIEVVDTTAPTLAPQVNQSILWPPNHEMKEISIATNVWDESGCYSIGAYVFSNEPEDVLGDGDTGPDFTTPVIDPESGTITLSLRAERAGNGDGRVYSIEIFATDCAGNSSSAIVEVSCPHDGKGN